MKHLRKYALHIVWLVALTGMLGSLYFSNVLHFPPCVLCWWQRICLYPMVLLVPIGIVTRDRFAPLYTLALGVVGFGIGLYHNLLYYNILPEAAAPCVQGISCTTKFIEWFGFVTIPLLSLSAFIIIIVMSVLAWKGTKYENGN
jgi:disulfide bond formation protein DsbB